MGMDVEFLRQALADNRTHISLAVVKKVEVLLDLSGCQVQVMTLPEKLEVIATVCWAACSQGGFLGAIPVADDLILLAYDEQGLAHVVSRLSSSDDKVPMQAKLGHMVVKAADGKKSYLQGDKVLIGKPDITGLIDPDEPLALGNVLVDLLTYLVGQYDDLLDKLIAGPIAMTTTPGSPAPTYPALVTALAIKKVDLALKKTLYLTASATNIISQTAFTER